MTSISNILIIDDHPVFLDGLSILIKDLYPDVTVHTAISCSDAKKIIKAIPNLDCIFLDYHIPDQNGMAFLQERKQSKNTIPTVLLTAEESMAIAHEALENGAAGFMIKSSESSIYNDCIQTVINGDRYIESYLHLELEQYRQSILAQLNFINKNISDRQRNILMMLNKGFSNQEISDILNISVRTIKADTSLLFELFEANNRGECLAEARQIGVVE